MSPTFTADLSPEARIALSHKAELDLCQRIKGGAFAYCLCLLCVAVAGRIGVVVAHGVTTLRVPESCSRANSPSPR